MYDIQQFIIAGDSAVDPFCLRKTGTPTLGEGHFGNVAQAKRAFGDQPDDSRNGRRSIAVDREIWNLAKLVQQLRRDAIIPYNEDILCRR